MWKRVNFGYSTTSVRRYRRHKTFAASLQWLVAGYCGHHSLSRQRMGSKPEDSYGDYFRDDELQAVGDDDGEHEHDEHDLVQPVD